MNTQVTCIIGDKPTRPQRILLLLRDFPEIRDSYDLIIEKYFATYRDDKAKFTTIERDTRIVQYDLGIFPPSPETRYHRKMAQKYIIEHRKPSFLSKLISLFS